jgi:hypothetical protein
VIEPSALEEFFDRVAQENAAVEMLRMNGGDVVDTTPLNDEFSLRFARIRDSIL